MSFSDHLNFPSAENISVHLKKQHPILCNDSYIKEKKIVEALADFFANSTKAIADIHGDVLLACSDKLTALPDAVVRMLFLNLSQTLEDYAKENKIKVEASKRAAVAHEQEMKARIQKEGKIAVRHESGSLTPYYD